MKLFHLRVSARATRANCSNRRFRQLRPIHVSFLLTCLFRQCLQDSLLCDVPETQTPLLCAAALSCDPESFLQPSDREREGEDSVRKVWWPDHEITFPRPELRWMTTSDFEGGGEIVLAVFPKGNLISLFHRP